MEEGGGGREGGDAGNAYPVIAALGSVDPP